MKYHRFDPYKEDHEKALYEKGAWFKQQHKILKLKRNDFKHKFSGMKSRKPRPVTLAGVKKEQ